MFLASFDYSVIDHTLLSNLFERPSSKLTAATDASLGVNLHLIRRIYVRQRFELEDFRKVLQHPPQPGEVPFLQLLLEFPFCRISFNSPLLFCCQAILGCLLVRWYLSTNPTQARLLFSNKGNISHPSKCSYLGLRR